MKVEAIIDNKSAKIFAMSLLIKCRKIKRIAGLIPTPINLVNVNIIYSIEVKFFI